MGIVISSMPIERRKNNMEIILIAVGMKILETITKWDGMVCVSGCL